MKVAVGSDHAGFALKQEILAHIKSLKHEALDLGTCNTEPVDYPDYAEAVGMSIMEGKAERGILICGSGVGVSVAANKLPGIRAAVCHESYSAHQGVEHDDMNVLVMGSRVIGAEEAKELVSLFLRARFSGEPRHRRRLEKIKELELRYGMKVKKEEKR